MDKNRLARISRILQEGVKDEEESPAPASRTPDSPAAPDTRPPDSPPFKPRRGVRWISLAVILVSLGVGLGAWWWKATAYRRFATGSLAGPIAAVEYQAYANGPFVQLRDAKDLADVKEFLVEARAEPERGEPGHELAIREPDCRMRIRFGDGRSEELKVGDTLPFTSGHLLALVLRSNAVIEWRGHRRYGAGDILGEVYGRLVDAGKLVLRESPAPDGSEPAEPAAGPNAPLSRSVVLGIPGHDARSLGIAPAAPPERRDPTYRPFMRLRLLSGEAKFAENGHQFLHVRYARPVTVSVVDAETGASLQKFEVPHPRLLVGAALSPNADLLMMARSEVTSIKTEVAVIDTASGNTVCQIRDFDGVQTTGTFSPDGSKLALAWSSRPLRRTLGLYDAASGESLWRTPLPQTTPEVPRLISFSRDGRWVLTTYEDFVLVSAARTGARQLVVDKLGKAGARFAPRGETVAAVSTDLTLRVMELSQRQELCRVTTPFERRVLAMDYTADGSMLTVALADNTVRFLSSADLAQRAGWPWHGAPARQGIHGLAFSPDGRYLMIRTEDDRARLVDLPANMETQEITPPSPWEYADGARDDAQLPGAGDLSPPFSGDGQFILLGFAADPISKRPNGLMLWGPAP